MLLSKELHVLLQEAPQGLHEVLERADATGRLRIIQQMSINIIPIIEKGLLDPVITHGCVPPPYPQIMPTAMRCLLCAR
jgi:hypothetical protein